MDRSRPACPICSAAVRAPLTKKILEILPGVLLAVAVMLVAGEVAKRLGALVLRLEGIDPAGRASPISGISMAIVLGLLVANTIGTAAILRPGLRFAMRHVLRIGIVLVGIRLSFFDVVKLGAWGAPVVAIIVAVALVAAPALARMLGVSDNLGTLAAASTAICGVTAALSVGPVIEAEEREVAYTVANVTLFGVVAMLGYPYLAHAVFGSSSGAVGLFLGTGIHDTSQVMGAALSYRDVFRDEVAFRVATVTKLTRNVFLVAVVPLLAYRHHRLTGHAGRRVRVATLFPLFILGFLGMAIVRSIGDGSLAHGGLAWGVWDAVAWKGVATTLGETWASAALGTAMAGVGLSTDLRGFGKLGWRPLYLGAISAALVAALALALAAAVGTHLSIGR
jgi:uncharacterized integral membrane protein (TIGR00698 family)